MNTNKIDYLLLGRVLKLALPYRSIFILAAVLAVVLAPLATLRPYLVKVMVDDYIFQYDIPGLTKIAILFCVVLLVEA
ncbi:MAG TPA: ABC transporter ATP-binding protein, partial [Saprospiraceae bacterium]|nr:ABC transporter ATP-binding protein [Saprospiraceae bacterium]